MVCIGFAGFGHMPDDADVPPVHPAKCDERVIADEGKMHPAWTVMHGQYVPAGFFVSVKALVKSVRV
jgi:hypothetical protein